MRNIRNIMILLTMIIPILMTYQNLKFEGKQARSLMKTIYSDSSLKTGRASPDCKLHLRFLSEDNQKNQRQQKQQDKSKEEKKYIFGWDRNQLMVAIGIFIVAVLAVMIIISSVLLALFVLKPGIKKEKKQKDNIDFEILCPEISYTSFLIKVCEPPQTVCCICLDQFHMGYRKCQNQPNVINLSKQQNELIICPKQSQGVENQMQITNKDQTASNGKQNFVQLTYCGHMFHSACFKKWLLKQYNCPMCRELFNYQNIKMWQHKTGVFFKQIHTHFFARGEQEYLNNNPKKLQKREEACLQTPIKLFQANSQTTKGKQFIILNRIHFKIQIMKIIHHQIYDNNMRQIYGCIMQYHKNYTYSNKESVHQKNFKCQQSNEIQNSPKINHKIIKIQPSKLKNTPTKVF